jgi:hypothetical protein
MNQENLFDRIEQVNTIQTSAGRDLGNYGYTISERFGLFHAANPKVYAMIAKMAHYLRNQGYEHCGMKMIFEQIRWKYFIQTKGDRFKLNNSFTSHYSRLLMQNAPELAGFFEVRGKE